ncbi:MAG TPA: class I SAM-dependent methyltransferase [Oscillatoriaceae cyanobacterium]
MPDSPAVAPDRSSIGSAFFRALHVQFDPPPHVFEDTLGLKLVSANGPPPIPPGMEPENTGRLRASIVARARYIEDLVAEKFHQGVCQYVILGAGLDTFAERRRDLASQMHVFEVDRPGPQAWKRQRLTELGYGVPDWLHLVPVDFEAGDSWWDELVKAGYDPGQPAVVASSGVSMHIAREATLATLRQCALLAPGSTLAMSYGVPLELVEPEERPTQERTRNVPQFTVFSPDEMLSLARDAGFRETRNVSAANLTERFFTGRPDSLRPSSYQDLLVAAT